MKSRVYYHLTESRLVPAILRSGLQPKANPDPDAYVKYKARVYLFNDADLARDAIPHFKRLRREGPFTVLRVDVPRGVMLRKDPEDFDGSWGAYYTTSRIPAKALRIEGDR